MTASLTAALIVTAVLGALFRTTKHLAIAAAAGLCFLFPWAALVVLLGVAAFIFWKR
jgi:hypothetical protein